ncbi:hypothetical protein Sgou_59180 [Streptomyces gougerotii]|uniref:Uncharacterized protein n=2 Tax=Streptomyces diastaticus group TaxID=2849069 RepID=A0A8H9LR84_9ACTN|nr:hypothetical protein Srut_36880 [Streptomyces rutgersensis]GFH72450.1 hypothetical protein Sdia_32180 [Streptomyces diastaticus subsp. diastaticus]GFH81248.1 hypothetical protein Sgou_59180 [Streptomyces gougerotii]GGU42800.1 hypothetical protein GCM10015534_51710 [Streptomyces diastaticus subsp. diastaticus]GGU74861.1 hypothetical protein GCM10010227_31520 [Streptomyces gougerotii]
MWQGTASKSRTAPTAPGTHARRTGRQPEHVRYDSFRQTCREHAPDTADTAQDLEGTPWPVPAGTGGHTGDQPGRAGPGSRATTSISTRMPIRPEPTVVRTGHVSAKKARYASS